MKLDEVIQQPGQMQRLQQESTINRVNVARPGTVVKYDSATRCVDVQPAIRDLHSSEIPPLMKGVPVIFLGGFVCDINPGDECVVIFADVNIDGWWQTGGIASPLTARRHDLSDGFALVGVHSAPNAWKGENLNDILDDHHGSFSKIEHGLAKVSIGNIHPAILKDEYVYIREHTSLDEGLYQALYYIDVNGVLTSNNVAAASNVLSDLELGKAQIVLT